MEFDKDILSKLLARPRQTSDASFETRREVENRVSHAPRNGHRKVATGRTEQINFRARSEFISELKAEAERREILLAVLLEEMWTVYKTAAQTEA